MANPDRAPLSTERPPIPRRAELGRVEASEKTLAPNGMLTSDDPTPPAPSQRDESQPWAPDELPIHRLDDLRDDALSPERPPLPLEEPDTLDEPPNASMLDDGPTVSGRNNFDVQAVTQDVSLTDILEEDGPPDPSTQNRFNDHFSNIPGVRFARGERPAQVVVSWPLFFAKPSLPAPSSRARTHWEAPTLLDFFGCGSAFTT